MMLKRLKEVQEEKQQELKERVNELYESLQEKLQTLRNCSDSEKMQELRSAIQQYWKDWTSLCDRVLSLQPS